MREIAVHIPCTLGCASSDGMVVYDNDRDDGKLTLNCFACGESAQVNKDELPDIPPEAERKKSTEPRPMWSSKQDLKVGPIAARKLKAETVRQYGIKLVVKGNKVTHHVYPHYDTMGHHVGNKVRQVDPKTFFFEGRTKGLQLFGQKLFTPNKNIMLTITEGHLDAVAGHQMMKTTGGKYDEPWVAIQNSNDLQSLKDNHEWLMGWKGIILMMDNDDAGREHIKEMCELFPAGYVKLFPHLDGLSDASDYLMHDRAADLRKQWWKATEHRPEGVVQSNDPSLKDQIKNFSYEKGVPYPFESWNEKTYGIRKGEFVLISARRGTGKTTSEYEIIHNIHDTIPDARIGCFFLEETKTRTALGLVSLAANIPLHVPESECSDTQFEEAYEAALGDGRIYIYDQCGVADLDTIEKYIRYFAKSQGCEYIFLDHIGRVRVPEMRNDERRGLDEVGARLSALCVELNISIIASAHLNREGEVRGSDGPENNAAVVIHLEKEEDESGRRMTKVTLTKNRLYGWLEGECDPLTMETSTGRIHELRNYNQQRDDIADLMEGE